MRNHLVSALGSALSLAGLAGQAPPFEVARYEVSLRVELDGRLVRGSATATITALDVPVARASFALNEALEVRSVLRDDAPARFELGERLGEGRTIAVALEPALAPGQSCRLGFEYAGQGQDPDPQGADWMGILLVRPDEVRMSHQAQWYPVVPRDERARSKLAAPMDLGLDLPAGWESLGPGELRKIEKQKGREVHRWSSARPVHASILAGRFDARIAKRGQLAVRVLAFPEHAAGAKAWGEDALESLAALSELYGKLDIATYGIGEMRVRNRSKSYNYEADGFSVYDGVLFDGRAPDARKIAHEVAHLWFGGVVDAAGAGERFLTEGLAEFAAWTALEARMGEAAGVTAAGEGTTRYFSSPGPEHSLAEADFSSPRYSQVVYSKGAFAVRSLRAWIGAEALAAGLRAYLAAAQEHGGAAGLDGFLSAMRTPGGPDVDAWAEDWLRRPGTPRYSVQLSGERSGTLVQTGDLYRNPVELELRLPGKKTRLFTVRPTQLVQPWEADVPGKIEAVAIDPRAWVLFERPR
jgi:hypothetical protein